MAFQDVLPFLKSPHLLAKKAGNSAAQERKTVEADSCSTEKDELASTSIRAALYKKIIERYAEQINAGEQKTLPELKSLVQPHDKTIQQIKARLLEKLSITEYAAEKDFTRAAQAALDFCRSLKPINAELPVSYWLSPAEVIELGAADKFDRALMFVSLLLAFGAVKAKIRVVELEGGLSQPLAVFEAGGSQFLCDPFQDVLISERSGSLDALLGSYAFEGKKYSRSLFEFDDKEYEQIAESGE